MPNYYGEKKYQGPKAIVIAMDIGTTQSAVSFAYFSPGLYPEAQMVTQWPGQPRWAPAKTPSMVSYKNGVFKACGEEAVLDFAEHPENVASWFKLHLHPAAMTESFKSPDFENPPLPPGITIERVYSDMMRYLMEHTMKFFGETVPDGPEIWARLRDTMVIVLATPNGWDMREQSILRNAAIRASLVTAENAGQLLQFVTEAEASVHYVLANELAESLKRRTGEWLRKRTVFAVVDCGGSTVDTTIYRCVSTNPLSLKEACPSQCVQAGGIFVDRAFKMMLERKLKGSSFSNPAVIQSMVAAFEKEVKPKFNGGIDEYHLRVGDVNDNDASLGISEGRITLSNRDLKPVFDLVINKIFESYLGIIITQKTERVLIVGGFGESPYLQNALTDRLEHHDIAVLTVGDSGQKAAAVGAMIGQIKQFVIARAARATFGGCVRQGYEDKLHRDRRHAVQLYADGKERVDGAFHVWVKKGTVLQGTFAHKLSYHVAWDATSTSKSELRLQLQTVGIEVFAWERDDTPPIWCKDEHGVALEGMRLVCILNADLSQLAGGIQIKTGPRKKRFYQVDYNVCIYFGGTQLRAKLQWKEKGAIREGPVTVMPYVS